MVLFTRLLVILAIVALLLPLNQAKPSAAPIEVPGQMPAVSSLFNRDRAAYFDLRSDEEVDQLLGFLLTNFPDLFLTYISNPADLQDDGLSVRPVVSDNGAIELLSGRLYSDEQVILLVDYRKMSPSQIAELNQLDNLITLFDYPDDTRKAIYTTNAIESLNSVIQKATRQRKIFPTDGSVMKVIYLAMEKKACLCIPCPNPTAFLTSNSHHYFIQILPVPDTSYKLFIY